MKLSKRLRPLRAVLFSMLPLAFIPLSIAEKVCAGFLSSSYSTLFQVLHLQEAFKQSVLMILCAVFVVIIYLIAITRSTWKSELENWEETD